MCTTRAYTTVCSYATMLIGAGAVLAGYSTLSANLVGFTFVALNNILTALSLTLVSGSPPPQRTPWVLFCCRYVASTPVMTTNAACAAISSADDSVQQCHGELPPDTTAPGPWSRALRCLVLTGCVFACFLPVVAGFDRVWPPVLQRVDGPASVPTVCRHCGRGPDALRV